MVLGQKKEHKIRNWLHFFTKKKEGNGYFTAYKFSRILTQCALEDLEEIQS